MSKRLLSLLPNIVPFESLKVSRPFTYIGSAGFEDRAMAFLNHCVSEEIPIEKALAIEYEPNGDPRNRVGDFRTGLEKICPSIEWLNYDRLDPQGFQDELETDVSFGNSVHIIFDISGMSKLLTMVLLQFLSRLPNDLTIAYAEADIYHPTRDEFEKEKRKLGATPDFLTSDVYTILHVTSLSSVAMQGYPILLIVYPTFNHNEVAALHNEISPQHMILLEGDPHEESDKWRLEAIREVNKNLKNPDYSCQARVASTFDYISNVHTLQEIYQTYCFTHKVVLAPTGSKLQTVASFLFRQLHPDVQIVYPVTKAFIGEYSEKCRRLWAIPCGSFSRLVSSLNECRLE